MTISEETRLELAHDGPVQYPRQNTLDEDIAAFDREVQHRHGLIKGYLESAKRWRSRNLTRFAPKWMRG